MTARTRTALLAVVASLGLVSLAYGVGGLVGGGSAGAAGAPSSGASAPSEVRFHDVAAHARGKRGHHPCPHMRDGGGSGSSDNSSDTAPTDAQAY